MVTPTEHVAFLIGSVILPTVIYGINATLVVMTLGLLWKDQMKNPRKRRLGFMFGHIVLVSALSTAHWVLICIEEGFSLAMLARLSVNPAYVLHPGQFTHAPYAIVILYVLLTLLTEGLLVRGPP